MTAAELLLILNRAFQESGPSGETPLDRLVRQASSEPEVRLQIIAGLPMVVPDLQTGRDWQALEILISQLAIRQPHIGEQVEHTLVQGQVAEPEANIWMARCAYELGGTLTSDAYRILEQHEVIQSNPTEWLAVLFDTSDPQAAANYFRTLPLQIELDVGAASDLVRLFKRKAQEFELTINGPLAEFFNNLGVGKAQVVANKLESVIGPSFKRPIEQHIIRTQSISYSQLDISSLFADAFKGLDSVSTNTKWGQQNAEAAYADAA